MKKKLIKNYIILAIIMFITFVLFYYLLTWYKHYNDVKLSKAVIEDTISSVTYNDIDTVVKERDFIILYLCTSSETKCRDFEDDFKDYINKKNHVKKCGYFLINSLRPFFLLLFTLKNIFLLRKMKTKQN